MVINDERYFSYDKKELSAIMRAFKAMSEEAQAQAKKEANNLAQDLVKDIQSAAKTKVARRVADGAKVSATSKIGEISFGFAGQKFSGGATTQFNYATQGGKGLLAGAEFGAYPDRSRKWKFGTRLGYPQFPYRTARFGVRGNEGTFIYPTLRRAQPEIVRKWETAFDTILKEYD